MAQSITSVTRPTQLLRSTFWDYEDAVKAQSRFLGCLNGDRLRKFTAYQYSASRLS